MDRSKCVRQRLTAINVLSDQREQHLGIRVAIEPSLRGEAAAKVCFHPGAILYVSPSFSVRATPSTSIATRPLTTKNVSSLIL